MMHSCEPGHAAGYRRIKDPWNKSLSDMEGSPGSRGSILAVMVTYHPKQCVVTRVRALRDQFMRVLVVDNTDDSGARSVLECLAVESGITVIYNNRNLGVARGYNQGIEFARRLGVEWVSTFDQDTDLLCDYGAILAQKLRGLPAGRPPVVLGASYVSSVNRRPPFESESEVGFEQANELISSGMTFSLSDVEKIGGFSEHYFIDLVDHEFCIRAIDNGGTLLRTKRPVMVHSVGDQTAHRVLFKRLWTNNHSPLRRYYFARNTILFIRRYVWRQPRMAVTRFRRMLKVMVLIMLFEKTKYRKMQWMAIGVRDGVLGRSGKKGG